MKSFKRVLFLSIFGTYLVILAGSVVRGTGSGIGCPDWPRCFGQWVPPMDISELPHNYKEVFQITGKTISDFDPFKTWAEYLNRLLGLSLGALIALLFALSYRMREYERNLPWFCSGLLFLIVLQAGALGLSVSTHLKPYIITVQMFLIVLLLFGLLYLRKYCDDLTDTALVQKTDKKALVLSRILTYLTFLQVLMGTQVRESVDHLIRNTGLATSETVIGMLGPIFIVHRSFSLIIIGLFLYLLFYFHRNRFSSGPFLLALMAFFAVLGNIVTGITLNYFGFPANAQPPHLFFAVLALGMLYGLTLNLRGTLLSD